MRQLLTAISLLALGTTIAHAQSSLGIGAAEQPVLPTTGPMSGFFTWVSLQQKEFYQLMTDALREIRNNPAAGWALIWLAFLYGILHAAGPGHGKVVISSYMLANETQLRRGIALSFASSFVQALSAIVIVGLGFLVLRQLSVSVTDTTRGFEIASYLMVAGLGLWLLFAKGRKALAPKPLVSLSSAAVVVDHHHHTHTQSHDHGHDHHHHHGSDGACSSCGHVHMPTPVQTGGTLKEQAALVLSVGARPCTGALVVLTFAFMNGLWSAGLVATFAMAFGTAITVSILATLAVTAKDLALRYTGYGALNERVTLAIEIIGALIILAIGVVLLGGALSN